MKFILNKDKLKIEDALTINSGSFSDYLIDVETDESWDGLSIEAIIAIEKSNEGISRTVINNQVYIDISKKERYTIGFIGYTIENNVKTYQRSTDLKLIPIVKGAGEIQATNTQEIPTESEWEIYLAQVQEFIDNGNAIITQANNLDIDVNKEGRIATVTIIKKDGTEKSVQISDGEKGDKGDDYVITQEDYQEIADIVENQINIPTKTSDLTNDDNVVKDASYVHTDNNYTSAEKTKLSGIETGAEENTINTIKVNGTSQTITSKAVDITVPTNNNQLTNGAGYQTASDVQTAINNQIGSAYKAKGSVAFASLPALSSSNEGNVYNVTDSFTTTSDFVEGAGKTYPAGTNVVIINTTGSTYKYDVLAGIVDLSSYVLASDLVAYTNSEIDSLFN